MTAIHAVLRRRAYGVVLGLLVDRALGEPPAQVHPVVGFGHVMQKVERRCWADRFSAGLLYATVGASMGVCAGRAVRNVPVAVAIAVAGRSLREAATAVEWRLAAGDLPGARDAVSALVGRDPAQLDASAISAAVVESLAENSVDAVVAPVFWTIVAGAPGAFGHRAVNTMDAMVGHRSPRYHRFGTAAARLDDVANYVPARIYAALVAVVRPWSARTVIEAVKRDAGSHPSPNSGVAEAAAAAALGRELGGPLRYGGRLEERPRLGTGPRPTAGDIARARLLAEQVELTLAAVLILAASVRRGSRDDVTEGRWWKR